MSKYIVFFRDGSSCAVTASGYFDAKLRARKVFPRKRIESVQHAHRQCG